MKRKLLAVSLAFLMGAAGCAGNPEPAAPARIIGITAAELTAEIRIGWNLGNTLDAHDRGMGAHNTVAELESAWGNPVTTRENFEALKNAGFNAARIPVTWHKACDEDYNIRADWMARVTEVVDYAAANDMYVIINVHHDEEIIKLTDREMEETKRAFGRLWEQIADNFRDYDEKLIFESINEPRTIGTPLEWQGGTPPERANINVLNQLFVDTVRASGGNNAYRILMITGYTAHAYPAVLNDLIIPDDTVADKIAVSIHEYVPYAFALQSNGVSAWDAADPSDTAPITEPIDLAYDLFVSRGIPVIMGEFGALFRGNTEAVVEWAAFYVGYARSKGIPCFWWDNGVFGVPVRYSWGWSQPFGLLNRETDQFIHPEIVDALVRAAN